MLISIRMLNHLKMQRNPIPLTFVISGLENRKMKLLTRWPPFLTGLVASFLHLSQIRSRALISDLFQSLLLILWLKWSGPLPVSGGCPQGSILGVWLFNVTTYDQEDDFVTNDQARLGLQPRHYREPPSPEHVNHREEAQPTISSPSQIRTDKSPTSKNLSSVTDLNTFLYSTCGEDSTVKKEKFMAKEIKSTEKI